jgi:hypothetical protein
MQATSEVTPMTTGFRAKSRDDLTAILVAVQQLREDLLDYNPVLAVMAEGLQRAVELEMEAQRCNNLLGGEGD